MNEILFYDARTDEEIRGIRRLLIVLLYGKAIRKLDQAASERIRDGFAGIVNSFLRMYPNADAYENEYYWYLQEECDKLARLAYRRRLIARFKPHDGGQHPGYLAICGPGFYSIVSDGKSLFEPNI